MADNVYGNVEVEGGKAMNAQQRFIKKLKNREDVVGCGLMNVNYSGIMNVYKACGMDYVLIDCEHGTLSDVSIEEILRTCRLLDLPTVVRVPGIHQSFIAKPMDMGADGIMVPRVDTVEQLDDIIKYYRFAPRGKKGIGGFAQIRAGEKLEEVNDNRVLCIQIESQEAANNLDAMLTKYPGEIQFVLVGPGDLSIDLGIPMDTTNEKELAVVKQISDTCVKHGVSLGMFCSGPEIMQFWKDHGVNVMWVTAELFLLQNEVNRVKAMFDELK